MCSVHSEGGSQSWNALTHLLTLDTHTHTVSRTIHEMHWIGAIYWYRMLFLCVLNKHCNHLQQKCKQKTLYVRTSYSNSNIYTYICTQCQELPIHFCRMLIPTLHRIYSISIIEWNSIFQLLNYTAYRHSGHCSLDIMQWNVANLIGHWKRMNHIWMIIFHEMIWSVMAFFVAKKKLWKTEWTNLAWIKKPKCGQKNVYLGKCNENQWRVNCRWKISFDKFIDDNNNDNNSGYVQFGNFGKKIHIQFSSCNGLKDWTNEQATIEMTIILFLIFYGMAHFDNFSSNDGSVFFYSGINDQIKTLISKAWHVPCEWVRNIWWLFFFFCIQIGVYFLS